MVRGEQQIHRRHHEQREQRADRQAAWRSPAPCRSATPRRRRVAVISGTTPSTIAAVVIRIGRNRMPAASSIASRLVRALLLQLVGELDDQDAVLADQAHQRDQARPRCRCSAWRRRGRELMKISAPAIDIGTDTRMISGSRKLSNSAASDRKMMISAKPKVPHEAAGFLHELPRQPAVIDRVALRQRPRRRGPVRYVHRGAQRDARRRHALDRRGIQLLEMVDRFRHRAA